MPSALWPEGAVRAWVGGVGGGQDLGDLEDGDLDGLRLPAVQRRRFLRLVQGSRQVRRGGPGPRAGAGRVAGAGGAGRPE